LVDHQDDRVRVEVIRALATLRGEDSIPLLVESLSDPSQRVRNGAVSLLRAEPSEEVVVRVAEYLATNNAEVDDARRLVKVIAERSSETAQQALAGLAEKRFAVGSGKVVRDIARAALGRRP